MLQFCARTTLNTRYKFNFLPKLQYRNITSSRMKKQLRKEVKHTYINFSEIRQRLCVIPSILKFINKVEYNHLQALSSGC